MKNVRPSRVKEPDLGIGYISAYLKSKGYETGVIDAFALGSGFGEIEERIKVFKPDCLGMPLFTFKVREAAEIARRAREWNPEIKVFVGGAHATALPVRTLEETPFFDFAVIGEGEFTTFELLEALAAGRGEFGGIKGLCWRDGEAPRRNPPRAFIRDLDALPFPDWGAFPLDKYFPLYAKTREFLELPVSSARGCAGRCSFCFRLTRGYIRSRSEDSVVAEIERDAGEFSARSVIFMDEAFTAEPERTRRLCEAMIRAGLHERVHWLCETRVDRADPGLLALLRRAGCSHVSFGVESGNQEILDRNRKGTTLEQAAQAVRDAKRAGLQVDTYYIFGLPWENRKTMGDTRRFSLRLDPDFANYFILVPYPGTLALKLARQGRANLKLLTEDWSRYGIQIGSAMELRDVTRAELERFQFVSYLVFYLRPRKWKSLFRIVSFRALPVYLLNILSGLGTKKRNP